MLQLSANRKQKLQINEQQKGIEYPDKCNLQFNAASGDMACRVYVLIMMTEIAFDANKHVFAHMHPWCIVIKPKGKM